MQKIRPNSGSVREIIQRSVEVTDIVSVSVSETDSYGGSQVLSGTTSMWLKLANLRDKQGKYDLKMNNTADAWTWIHESLHIAGYSDEDFVVAAGNLGWIISIDEYADKFLDDFKNTYVYQYADGATRGPTENDIRGQAVSDMKQSALNIKCRTDGHKYRWAR